MKAQHYKIITGLLILVLILAGILYHEGFRQPTPNPDAPSFADSIIKSHEKADEARDTTQKRHGEYEANLNRYIGPVDSIERDKLGARIEAAAQADSLRKRSP